MYTKHVFLQYYQDKFQTSPGAIRQAHWEAYAITRKALPPALKRFATKVTIRWLPSASRLKLCGTETNNCHLCPLVETNNHIYQCTHRIPTFLSRHAGLQKYMLSIHTPEHVSTAISTGILKWAMQASQTATAKSIRNPSPDMLQCFHRQTTLGWDAATFGIMDSSWSTSITQGTGTHWQAKLSRWLINSAYSIWLQRNAERYSIDPATQQSAQRLETKAQIIKVYGLAAAHLSSYDHHELIKETVEERLQFPEPTNRIWAMQIQRLIYLRIRHNKTRPSIPDIR